MGWNSERYEILIQQLETYANHHPALYRLQVGMLAVLGYLYLFIILSGLAGLLVGLVWLTLTTRNISQAALQLIAFSIFLLVVILQSLWVKFPPPEGLKLERSQLPHLFGLIDDLSRKLQVPRIHHVLLTDKFNASVYQVPRLGILGWYESYLILGLPFMQATSPEQFQAILAHEFGHLSGNHSRFAGWIYRVRKSWLNILDRLQHGGNHSSTWLFKPFFNWYAPFFYAYSFVLARLNEYEADRCAAQQTSPEHAAEALLNVKLQSQKLQGYWDTVYEQVEHQIEVPIKVYSQLLSHLKIPLDSNEHQAWLKVALAEKTNFADTHPCIRDRLSALGYSSTFSAQLPPKSPTNTAAEELLGSHIEQYARQFDQNWAIASETLWRQRYVYIQKARQAIEQLTQKSEVTPLTSDESWELACYVNELDGAKAALPYFEAVIKLNDSHVAANQVYGTLLLAGGDAVGIQYLEKAAALDPRRAPNCYATIYHQLYEQGNAEEANVFLFKWKEHSQIAEVIEQKRSKISHSDRFKPHGLPEEVISDLRKQLAQNHQIREAYLVQKVIEELQGLPTYLLIIWYDFSFNQFQGDHSIVEVEEKLANEISFLGGDYFLTIRISFLKNKVRKIPDTNIYKR